MLLVNPIHSIYKNGYFYGLETNEEIKEICIVLSKWQKMKQHYKQELTKF